MKRKKSVKQEPSEVDDSSLDVPLKRDKRRTAEINFSEQPIPVDEEKHLAVMENLVEVMRQQSAALAQLAQASAAHAQAMERLAEASEIQSRAVERLAGTLEAAGGAARGVRDALCNIDYTMKRCYAGHHA